MKKFLLMILIIVCFVVTSCSPKDVIHGSSVKKNEDIKLNPLTGILVDKDIADLRPVAVVINNIKKSLPQSGISQADMYYEVLAEGDITRIIALFKDFDSNKIGSIRSARDYFLSFVSDNDAILVHHGGSPDFYKLMENRDTDAIDGMKASKVFFRDVYRMSMQGMYEHSSYTDSNMIKAGIIERGFEREYKDDFMSMFDFLSTDEKVIGEAADYVVVPYSHNYQSVFVFDKNMGAYKKFQEDDPHMDEEIDEQLEVSNIIIQEVDIHVIQGDDAGRRSVDLIGSGRAMLITNGYKQVIYWSKEKGGVTTWYREDGTRVSLKPGKTWICIHDNLNNVTLR